MESGDEIMSNIMDDESRSEEVLQKIVALRKDRIIIPTFDTFAVPTEAGDEQEDWSVGVKMPVAKFYCQVRALVFGSAARSFRAPSFAFYVLQIYYDLGAYKVYRELTSEAGAYFLACKNLYDQSRNGKSDVTCDEFCEIKVQSLTGFCRACGVTVERNQNLVLKFYSAVRDNYTVSLSIIRTRSDFHFHLCSSPRVEYYERTASR